MLIYFFAKLATLHQNLNKAYTKERKKKVKEKSIEFFNRFYIHRFCLLLLKNDKYFCNSLLSRCYTLLFV